jgi:hypothetical protein
MKVRIEGGDIHRVDLRTRMPFKYGIATMTETPHVFVRLRVQVDGKPSVGIAADHLPPKWFTKNPEQPITDEILEMVHVIRHAVALAAGLQDDSPFDLWRQHYKAVAHWGLHESLPPLLTQFGASLVERAMIEAVCRAVDRSFAEMLRTNQFGIRLGELHEELKGHEPADFLPPQPRPTIIARHTVGLADPLTDADIPASERLADGLPQSLAGCIQTYGLRHFKLKVNGKLAHDCERLKRIAAIVAARAPADYAFTLDGNEQFHSLVEFVDYWSALAERAELSAFWPHLLFIEQPFHREVALLESAVGGLRAWLERPAIIIDESDAEMASLHAALRRGYAGTSHKNCKGVFKSVVNACLLAKRRRQRPAERIILSGEDLANIGPIALLQDLAVCAALGIESVERNGHHYFAGLSMFPAEVQRQIHDRHRDLYQSSRDGWPTLSIRDGMLDLRSVNAAPFGVGFELDVAQFQPIA